MVKDKGRLTCVGLAFIAFCFFIYKLIKEMLDYKEIVDNFNENMKKLSMGMNASGFDREEMKFWVLPIFRDLIFILIAVAVIVAIVYYIKSESHEPLMWCCAAWCAYYTYSILFVHVLKNNSSINKYKIKSVFSYTKDTIDSAGGLVGMFGSGIVVALILTVLVAIFLAIAAFNFIQEARGENASMSVTAFAVVCSFAVLLYAHSKSCFDYFDMREKYGSYEFSDKLKDILDFPIGYVVIGVFLLTFLSKSKKELVAHFAKTRPGVVTDDPFAAYRTAKTPAEQANPYGTQSAPTMSEMPEAMEEAKRPDDDYSMPSISFPSSFGKNNDDSEE